MLVDRYRHYARSLKLKKGGRGREEYRSQLYEVLIEDSDIAVDSVAIQQKVVEFTKWPLWRRMH